MFTQLVAFFLQNYDESKMNFELNIRQYETENRNQFAKSCFFSACLFSCCTSVYPPPFSQFTVYSLPPPPPIFFTIEWGLLSVNSTSLATNFFSNIECGRLLTVFPPPYSPFYPTPPLPPPLNTCNSPIIHVQ